MDEDFDGYDWDNDDVGMDEDDYEDNTEVHNVTEMTATEVQDKPGYRSMQALEDYLGYIVRDGYGYYDKTTRKYTRRIVDKNVYAKLYQTTYHAHEYSCHSYLASGNHPDSIVISAIYHKQDDWSFDDQNKYFEYVLSDESPWRDLFPYLDLNVIRCEETNHILWIQVRSLDVNRYVLFHFLKAFRQVWERRSSLKLFTDAVNRGVKGPELYDIYLLCQLLSDSCTYPDIKLFFESGGDHKVLKGFPNEALLNRTIPDIAEKQAKTDEFYSSSKNYYDRDLQSQTFGDRRHKVLRGDEFIPITTDLRSKLSEKKILVGYLFQRPQVRQEDKCIDFGLIEKNLDTIREYLKEKGVGYLSTGRLSPEEGNGPIINDNPMPDYKKEAI